MTRPRIRWQRLALLVGGIAGLCLLACVLVLVLARPIQSAISDQLWNHDPKIVAEMARSMAEYDLPPGFRELKSFEYQGRRTAIFYNPDQPLDKIIFEEGGLISSKPGDVGAEEAIYGANVDGRRYNAGPVGTRPVTIRGEPVTLSVLEGREEGGQDVRMWLGRFAGKKADVLLVIAGDIATWDEAALDRFIKSIQ